MAEFLYARPEHRGAPLAFVFPQAPTQHGMAAWWPINVMEWQATFFGGGDAGIAKFLRTEHPGMAAARDAAHAMLRAIADDPALGAVGLGRVVLGGFSQVGGCRAGYGLCGFVVCTVLCRCTRHASQPLLLVPSRRSNPRSSNPSPPSRRYTQGAMVALDAALSLSETLGGVVAVSGLPLTVDTWAGWAKRHGGKLAVWQAHGRADMLLPFQAAEWLRDLLRNGGVAHTFEAHGGGHDFGPPETLHKLSAFLEERRKALLAAPAGAAE